MVACATVGNFTKTQHTVHLVYSQRGFIGSRKSCFTHWGALAASRCYWWRKSGDGPEYMS